MKSATHDRPAEVATTARRVDHIPQFDRLKKTVSDLQLATKDVSIRSQQMVAGQTFTTGGPGYDRRIVLPINPYKVRAYLANAQAFADGSTVTVNFNTTSQPGGFDTANGFNATTHQYTIQVAGYYQVNVVASLQSPAQTGVTNSGLAALWRVGDANPLADGIQSACYNQGVGSLIYGVQLNDIVNLNAGDLIYVQVTASSNGAGNQTIQASVAPGFTTYWSMHLISA